MYSSIFVTELIDWDILAFVGWGSLALIAWGSLASVAWGSLALIAWGSLASVAWGSLASVNRAGTGEKILLKVPFYGQFLNMESLFYEATSTIRKTSLQYQSTLSTFWYRIKLLLPVPK